MDKNVDISVVLLTYFHEQYIHKALDTILSQKGDLSYEIIIADDCSKDNTVNVIKEYQERYPEKIMPIFNQQNLGICRNVYNACMECKGKYIALTSGDDCWTDEYKLKKQFDFLEEHDDFVAQCTLVEMVYTDGEKTGVISPDEKFWGREFFKEEFYAGDKFCDAGILFRNIFQQDEAKSKLKLLYEFSRDINDLTFDFFLFDYGKVYISDSVSYALTVRRESDVNQHNYNSKYKGVKNAQNHLDLIRKIDNYYENKICLKEWYRPYFGEILYYAIREREISAMKSLRFVPWKYYLEFVNTILLNKIDMIKIRDGIFK